MKQVKIKRCKVAEDMVSFFDKWSDPTAIGFLTEWSLEKIYNGTSTKELDNLGIDFISEGGKTFQVKCSTVGTNASYNAMIKKCRNTQYIILAYADVEEKKIYYTVN